MSCSVCLDSTPSVAPDCPILYLPAEILLQVLSYLNTEDILACSGTCKHWRAIINQSESLWKLQCLTLDSSSFPVQLKAVSGNSWKEIFQQNYSVNGIKNLWKQGTFSNPKTFQDLPSRPFCKLDRDSWGKILEWELERV